MEILKHPTTIAAIIGLGALIVALLMIRKVKFNVRMISLIGSALALSSVLGIYKLYELPAGGSVTLGAMIPIILISFFYGPETGFLTGLLYGIISLILNPFIVHPVQVLFDYPLPFMALGLAGYFKNRKFTGTIVAILARFTCHFISGVVFWASSAPAGTSPYLYSFLYNASYMSIDGAICIAIIAILPLKQLYLIANKNTVSM